MESVSAPLISEMLVRPGCGERKALERVFPLIYGELHRLASRRRAGRDETLGTTSLVHEAYLKMFEGTGLAVTSRNHFFAVAATAMRQIIVDRARAERRQKRGGAQRAITLDEAALFADEQAEQILAVDDAIGKLDAFDPRLRRVVECRYYAGLTDEQTGAALGVSSRTVRSDWVKARALLRGWLRDDVTPNA